MDSSRQLLVAMAEKCSEIIRHSDDAPGLPKSLHPKHLLWMCRQIVEHSDVGSQTKLHRWIGFIQGGMLANQMLDLDGIKTMFDEIKSQYGAGDADLVDHLNPNSGFHFEIGGEG